MTKIPEFTREPLPWGGYRTDLARLTDGRVLCCICFAYFARDQLEPVSATPGQMWDVCRECAAHEGGSW